MSSAYRSIVYEVDGAIACIRLNRPQAFNAINPELLRELINAVETVAMDASLRVLVITGAGRAFCAGADLRATLADMPRSDDGLPDLGRALEAEFNPLVLRLRSMPQPVIAAVNGVAAGGGASLALAADLTIAARSASFAQVFANIGLIPDLGGTWTLSRALGRQKAMGVALLGQTLSAEDAHRAGLIWDVTDDDALMPQALALARKIAASPRIAITAIKQALHAADDHTLAQQLDLERDLQRQCGRSPDFMEAVTAFVEKRTPQHQP